MKIIILAAGKGERLLPLTRNTPKPLIDLGDGRTLLEHQIEQIAASGVIDEIVLVAGYLIEQIDAKIKYYSSSGLKINVIYNPFFDISNNLISLWLAKNEMTESFLVTNGDNLFHQDVYKQFIENNHDGVFLAVCHKDHFDGDDMKVTLKNGLVERVAKNIEPESVNAESPGLLLVDGGKSVKLVQRELDFLVRDRGNRDSFWLKLPTSLANKSIPVKAWPFDAKGKWQEVDIHLDIEKVCKLIAVHLNP